MSKRTLLLIIVLIVVTSLLLYIALKGPTIAPTNYKQPVTTTTNQTAQAILSFGTLSSTPSTISATPTYSLPVLLQTGNRATAVQLELQYDQEVLTNVSLQPGSFFTNPVILINQVDEATGRISYALGISPSDVGKMGQGTVAVLTFEAINTTPQATVITFLPKSLVTAEGTTQSVLKSTKPITITIGKSASPSIPASSTNAQ